jgi:hypothetical protein
MEMIGAEILYWQRKLEINKETISSDQSMNDSIKQRIQSLEAPNWTVPKCARGSERVAALEEMTSKLIQTFDS